MQAIITELTEYLKVIETFDKDSAQDGQVLHSYLIDLTNKLARANFIMAEYKMKVRKQKAADYITLAKSEHSKQSYYAPSLAKDYIDAQSAEVAYVFDLAERLSRCIVHSMDALRTIISSLKSERTFSNY
jgi:hypothetical protein